MHSSEDDPEKDTITSDAESLIKLNPFTTDMRDHMIKHAIEIKFVKNRYTTPMIVEFSSPLSSGNNTINIAATHCKIFAAMEILNSNLKLITQVGKVYENPKNFPTGNDYTKPFPNTTEELDRYKSKKNLPTKN